MSRTGEVRLLFADDEYSFRLGLKELRLLQEKCADKLNGERGPFTILRDLQMGTWRVNDVVWTIQLGLEGAGMKKEDAAKLVRERFEDRVGIHAHAMTAALIINAAMVGPEDDQIDRGKQAGEATTSNLNSPPSPSQPSSDRPLSSAGQPDKSMN